MSDSSDMFLCTFTSEKKSRTEINAALVFNPELSAFRIRVSQGYENQAKIEVRYLNADLYLADHPGNQELAKRAIDSHIAANPEQAKPMKAALARMKSLS